MLKPQLERVLGRQDLTRDEMAQAIGVVMDGAAESHQVAALLAALRTKGETIEEITGAALAMRARMLRLDVPKRALLDTCGTGGDGKSTFNISTAAALVAAACGVSVAKHGNRAVSSLCGSADVLLAAGVRVDAAPEVVRRCVLELGVGFLFAPTFHPAMKNVAPIRKAMGVRTLFNVLGPLCNPAGASHQLLGVYADSLRRPMASVLAQLGCARAWVVHAADGLDELSILAPTCVTAWDGRQFEELVLRAEDYGLASQEDDTAGHDVTENARLLRLVLAGGGPRSVLHSVLWNSAAALVVSERVATLREGVELARTAVASARPLELLEQLASLTKLSGL